MVFGGLAYQQNAQDRPSSRKGTVAAQSAFIGRSAYSRKNTSADSSACASLTCESRAYSVILQQKGSAQQGMAVYLTAFRINYAPPAKVLLLFSLRRLPMGSEASLHWRSIFESTTSHVAKSLNVWTLDLISLRLAGELCCFGIIRIENVNKTSYLSFYCSNIRNYTLGKIQNSFLLNLKQFHYNCILNSAKQFLLHLVAGTRI